MVKTTHTHVVFSPLTACTCVCARDERKAHKCLLLCIRMCGIVSGITVVVRDLVNDPTVLHTCHSRFYPIFKDGFLSVTADKNVKIFRKDPAPFWVFSCPLNSYVLQLSHDSWREKCVRGCSN